LLEALRDDNVLEAIHDSGPLLIQSCGKLVVLDKILARFRLLGRRVLIFCQMKTALDYLEQYCEYRGYQCLRLDGDTAHAARAERIASFNAKDSPCFIFLLSTRAGGVGLNLQSADTVILYDSDWNPQADQQAQARAHRIGQVRGEVEFEKGNLYGA